jgi:SAM-dependent methyltransferase
MVEPIDNSGVLCTSKGKCLICGMPGKLIHEKISDSLFSAPGEWSIRACVSCDLVWLDPQPNPDQIWKLYRSYYTHNGDTAGVSSYRSMGLKHYIKLLLSILPFPRAYIFRSDLYYLAQMTPGRLLEVGCGDGSFLAAAALRGWQSFGVDADAAAVDHARRFSNITVEQGELINQTYPPSSFRAIVMNNAIEHVWNPTETIIECYRLLESGGRLVVITPNCGALGRALFGKYWRGLEPPRHLFIFGERSLRVLAQRAGFSRIRIGLLRREYISSLLGTNNGEWIVLLADKQ